MTSNNYLSDTGFILTRDKIECSGQIYLVYWVLTDTGPVKLLTPPQREIFFILQQDLDAVAEQLFSLNLSYESKKIDLKTFQREPVAALYFDKGSLAFKAKQALQKVNIVCFETDIRLTERFLMERFIYGGTQFFGVQSAPTIYPESGFPIYQHAQLKPAVYTPSFKVLSLDIECSEEGVLYSIGLVGDSYRCVIMRGDVHHDAPSWIVWVETEKALLNYFVQAVQDYDPDIFIGWNVINFDFRLLIQRAKINSVALLLGREFGDVYWRDARGEVNQGYITMAGRVVVDGIDALKTATYQFESFGLEFVSQKLLGVGKKLGSGAEAIALDDRMAAINHDFQYNKVKLAEYNLQDCKLVADIFEHTQLLSFLILRSQITGLELDKQGGSVAAFVNLYLPKLHRAGYVSPNRPEDGGLASPGGYVMDSCPGLYTNVLVFDFKSLYPSIIRTFKIDPLGLVEGLHGRVSDGIAGYKGAVFSRDKHFLPDIITTLWQQRDEAKKNKDAARSQAIKILMNSFYGVLGSGGCPFYDTRLASSITMRGHDIMQITARWIEEKGYQVIYGDTDSTFVWLDGLFTAQQAREIGRSLQIEINKRWEKKVFDEFQLECFMELEFETHFTQFLMPTIRGSKMGSKKRYAGIKSTANGESELVFKGLETVRSDWTELAKEFQFHLYTMVFAQENVEAYILQMVKRILDGVCDDKLIYRKRLRRPLAHYIKNVPPHVKAARQADLMNQSLGKSLKYQNKGWISYVVTLNGPEAVEYRHSQIDYQHYISKQIQPIADGILPFINTSFEQITAIQLRLFS